MAEKRYFWIKLRTDFFAANSAMDLLMSQDNGSDYVVLYQMLCLQTVNTGGRMAASVGDVLMPYDIRKIARDTKYFDVDTVTVALSLFQKLGLIYEEQDGIIALTGYDEMVGSEQGSADRVRRFRERRKEQLALQSNDNERYNATIEYRDKSIELENSDRGYTEVSGLEEGDGKPSQRTPRKRFVPPTVDEVRAYCEERKNGVDPEKFVAHYERVGWKVGKHQMKDWKAGVRYWERDSASSADTSVHFKNERRTANDDDIFDDLFGGDNG